MTRKNIFIEPYFDDYYQDGGAQENNYHRILYRPGFAVQARELTQGQTIIQDQIRRFGNNIFQDGSLVTGGGFHSKNNIPFVRIKSTFVNSPQEVDFTANGLGDEIKGRIIRGETSSVEAEIIEWYQDGGEKVLYLNYTRNGGSNGVYKSFIDGEKINIENYAEDIEAIDSNATGKGVLFQIDPGYVYSRGFFIQFPKMSVVVSPLTTDVDAEVGFLVEENFITAQEDGNLLDIATGSPNFNSPGAHRLQVVLSLVKRDIGTSDSEDFIPLLRFKGGVPTHKRDTPQYNMIRDEMARQNYDFHGHVAIDPFNVTIREHLDTGNNDGVYPDGDNTKLVARISPGRSYVSGFEVTNDISRNISFDKALETNQIDDTNLTFSFGNYFKIENIRGTWCSSCYTVKLFDATQDENLDTVQGTEIGTAKFYVIQYESTGVFRLFLFDINMTNGSIRDTRGVRLYDDLGNTNSVADVILSGGDAVLYDTNLRSLVYRLPQDSISELRDDGGNVSADFEYSGRYLRNFSSGSVSLIISEAGEEFPFGVGSLASSEIATVLVFDSATGVKKEVSSAEQTDATTINITLSDGSFSDEAVISIRVRRTNAKETRKIIHPSRYVKINASSTENIYNLGFSDVFKIESITSSTVDFDPSGDDVTDWFILDNGQRDAFYGHGKIRLKSGYSLNGNEHLLVKLSYFEPDFSEGLGYYSINSYPIDDTTSDINSIRTWDIPAYYSRNGDRYNLQDCVDFRNSLVSSAADAIDPASATIDPSETDSFIVPPNGIRNIVPYRSFSTALSYYLPYYVTISINKNGEFELNKSNANENPSAPKAPKQNMTLATVQVNEYPSLAPKFAKSIDKEDFAVEIRGFTHKVFTDSDINNIEKRLESLEKEVSLNSLEREADARRYADPSSGIDRFKNGFVTDNFQDHNVGDYTADGYSAAISSRDHKLLPSFHTDFVDLKKTDSVNASN